MTEQMRSRLGNWKFATAAGLLDADDKSVEAETIRALNCLFANCGWFDGDMGTVVHYVVGCLLEAKPEAEQLPAPEAM